MGEVSNVVISSAAWGGSSKGPAVDSGEGGKGMVRYGGTMGSQEAGNGFSEEVAVESPLEDEGADVKEYRGEAPISDFVPVLTSFPGREKYFSL